MLEREKLVEEMGRAILVAMGYDQREIQEAGLTGHVPAEAALAVTEAAIRAELLNELDMWTRETAGNIDSAIEDMARVQRRLLEHAEEIRARGERDD